MDTESVSDEQQIRIARVGDRVLVALDGPPLDSHPVGQLVLGEVGRPA